MLLPSPLHPGRSGRLSIVSWDVQGGSPGTPPDQKRGKYAFCLYGEGTETFLSGAGGGALPTLLCLSGLGGCPQTALHHWGLTAGGGWGMRIYMIYDLLLGGELTALCPVSV